MNLRVLFLALSLLGVFAGVVSAQVVTIVINPGTPYFEDFENETASSAGTTCPNATTQTLVSLGWQNESGELPTDNEWTPDSNGTGSGSTGPSGPGGTTSGGVDQSPGTTAGIYLYTETSGSCAGGDVAILTSPLFDASIAANPGFDYWYHLFGAEMGDLHTDVVEWFNASNDGSVTSGTDQFTSITSLFTANHVGTQITLESGTQTGTYTILSVISPNDVQLDTTFATTETALTFRHTELHQDVIPSMTDDQNIWQNTGDISFGTIATSGGPFIDGVFYGFQIQIRGVSGTSFGSDMAVDSVRVRDLPQVDFAVGNLIAPVAPPVGACTGLGTMETITVEIVNLSAAGIGPGTIVPIQYSVDGGTPVVDSLDLSNLPPFTNTTHTFATPANLSALGTVNVDVTIMPGDGDSTNDSNSYALDNPSVVPQLLPFVENFDTFGAVVNQPNLPPNWINDPNDGTNDWRMENNTTPSAAGPPADHTTGVANSGFYAYVEDSTTANAAVNMLTPCLDLSGTTNPVADFWVFSKNVPNVNTFSLDVVTTGGVVSDVIPQLTTHTNDQWTQFSANLSAFIGQAIRIQFRGDDLTGGSSTNDVSLDDVRVRDLTTIGLGQAPQPGIAVLDINGSTEINGLGITSGLPGIYSTTVATGTDFDIVMSGEANQGVLFLAGTSSPGAFSVPPFGQLDLTPVSLLADGTMPGFLNSLFRTGAAGTRTLTFPATSLLTGQVIGFQIIIFNTVSVFGFSNTVEATFN